MPDDIKKDYTEEMIEDIAKEISKDPDGKQLVEVAGQLKKQLLIKEYIDEATEGMGGKQRKDVARELKSHILDSADALAAERNVPVDENIVKEVLAKMGRARKIAAMYPTKKTFFGQGMGKALLSLVGLALAFLAVVALLQVLSPDTLKVGIPGSDPAQNVLSVVLSVVSALAIAIVVIACIFMAMYVYETSLKTPYEDRLKALEKSLDDVSSPLSAALRIVGTAIWLVLLNVFWARAPFVQSFTDNAMLVPLLSDKFAPFVAYFNVLGVIGIVLSLAYFFIGLIGQKWIPPVVEAFMDLLGALLFIWIMSAFPFNPDLAAGPVTMIKFVLAVIIIGCLAGAAKHLWDAMKFALYGRIEKSDFV